MLLKQEKSMQVLIFTLFEFSAKWDPVPTMLCQNHTKVIKVLWGKQHHLKSNF